MTKAGDNDRLLTPPTKTQCPLRGTHKVHHDVFVPLHELLERVGRQPDHVPPAAVGQLQAEAVPLDTAGPESGNEWINIGRVRGRQGRKPQPPIVSWNANATQSSHAPNRHWPTKNGATARRHHARCLTSRKGNNCPALDQDLDSPCPGLFFFNLGRGVRHERRHITAAVVVWLDRRPRLHP